ncbi:hypothetical protein MJI37_33940, partial [Salmonella enterica subsp. enterica serovar Cerro]|nr:hypothetical protein [Salmonella enterica subsp. enterica serovar Cerro]
PEKLAGVMMGTAAGLEIPTMLIAGYFAKRLGKRLLMRIAVVAVLNTISHEGDIDARRYPQAAASVLNYGLPPLAGSFMYEHKWD